MERVLRRFGVVQGTGPGALLPRFNVAPTQEIAAVVVEGGRRVLKRLRWGLVPRWADSSAAAHHMINARAETVAEKPAFREALRQRRCLIPADGFYEWRKEPVGKGKTPMCIQLRDRSVFAFAGLWERWRGADGRELESCAIITVPANEKIAAIHDRMPAILRREDEDAWLDPAITDPAALLPLLKPLPPEAMVMHEVSPRVNKPEVDEPSLIDEADPPPHTQGSLF